MCKKMNKKVKINQNLFTNYQVTRNQRACIGQNAIVTHISINSQQSQRLLSRHNKSNFTIKLYKINLSQIINKAKILIFFHKFIMTIK